MKFKSVLFSILCHFGLARSMSEPKLSMVYYDHTKTLNAILDGGIDTLNETVTEEIISDVRRHSKSFYYSTDLRLSDINELANLTDWISNVTGRRYSLLLSFRLLKNGALDQNLFKDIFYNHSAIKNADFPERKSLRRQIGRIVLDFTQDMNQPCLNDSITNYLQELNVSLPLYAKILVGNLLGTKNSSARMSVGVRYNLHQVNCSFIQSQLSKADFAVVGIYFQTVSKSPLSFGAMQDYMNFAYRRNQNFLPNSTRVIFHINVQKHNIKIDEQNSTEIVDDIVRWSQDAYFLLLDMLAIVLSDEDYASSYNKGRKHFRIAHEIVRPYLFIHETEASPCALQTLLSSVEYLGRHVILNEYTWNAIVHSENDMDILPELFPRKCPNATSIYTGRGPSNAHILLSKGTGRVWNFVENSLTTLLSESSSAANFALKTLIFHASDLMESVCGKASYCGKYTKKAPRIGILSFIDNSYDNNRNLTFGCAVDFGPLHLVSSSSQIITKTGKDCIPIQDNASIFIWKFDINFQILDDFAQRFSFDFQSSSLKYKMFQVLIARKLFMKENEGSDVIIQVQPDHFFFEKYGSRMNSSCANIPIDSYAETWIRWAQIHDVKMMIRPIYDAKYPWFGLRPLPRNDGKIGNKVPRCYLRH